LREVLERIESGEVPEEWFVVGLHSKEREIKIKSRLFVMMTPEMRMYFAATEKNLANGLLKYLQTQTMTWSEAELSKYLFKITGHSVKKYYIPVTFSLDYEKFNQRWRYSSTYHIFNTMDRLYGLKNVYKFSHLFFENAFFYLLHPCHRHQTLAVILPTVGLYFIVQWNQAKLPLNSITRLTAKKKLKRPV